MIDLLAAWVWFPIVLVAAAAGWGLLAERAAGHRLPGALVPPLGYAAIVCVSQIVTLSGTTAELAVPVVATGALAGLWAARSRVRPDLLPAGAALAVFVVLGAPVFLSGEATFAGYSVLGDTAIHFIGVGHLMSEGQAVAGLAPSTYQEALRAYFDVAGYPSGSHTALGSVVPLGGLDVAWLFQPHLAVLGALTALALWTMCETLAPRERALAAVLGALPALYVGYVLIASVKEVATVLVVALMVALVAPLARAPRGPRRVIPLAVAAGAGLGVVGLAVAPWLGLVLLAALVAALATGGVRALWPEVPAFLALVAVLAIPTILVASRYVEVAVAVTTSQVELGYLFGPLPLHQALPVWPVGDLRLRPDGIAEAMVWASALVGVAGLARLRARPVWLYLGVSVVATAYLLRRGSPWADAKTLMILSPAVATAAAAGALSWGSRAVRLGLVAVLAAGIAWSAAVAYHDVSLAPKDRLEELAELEDEAEGRTLVPEFEEFAKHFLSEGDPVVPNEPYYTGPVAFTDAPRPPFGSSLDLSHLDPGYVSTFETLLLRRSPLSPLPPGDFAQVAATEHYALWRNGGAAGAEPACDPSPVVIPLAGAPLPPFWGADPREDGSVSIHGAGTATIPFDLAEGGDFTLWLGGSVGREIRVHVDGRRVGAVEDARNYGNNLEPVGEVSLEPGRHELRLERSRGNLEPGDGSGRRIGPVVLARAPYRCTS